MSVLNRRRDVAALLACLLLFFTSAAGAARSGQGPAPQISKRPDGVTVQRGPDWVSPAVAGERIFIDPRSRPRVPEWRPGDPIREIPRRYHGDPRLVAPNKPPVNPVLPGLDPLAELQRAIGPTRGASAFTTPLVSVDGMGNTGVSPSDVNGDIGTTHFVQAINGSGGAQYAIYDKTTGALVAGPFNMQGLGTGGSCATGLGDPIVLFDELARRWMLSEFTSGSNDLCIYISAVEDPSAAQMWTRYVFTPANSFPDYPHYGVFPDAYYLGTNQGNATRPVCAMDRVAMLAGQAAQMKCFFPDRLSGFGFQLLQPADHDGDAPPAGAPGIFMRHRDDEVHNTGSNNPTQDFVEYYEFRTNWVDTNQATLTGPITVAITDFSSDLNGLSAFEAFPQPNGQLLDPLREPVMFRLAYRNFGTHETLLGNFVTDVDGNDTGGVRWFELRRVGGIASPWTLFQEGTYAPTDAGGPVDRWMGGIAMDESGNIALGYSVVRQSPAVFPGLRYVGRLDGDAAGVMTTAETTLVAGAGSQTNERWGDYHSMGIDPADGCTFWFTGQYVPTNVWQTRIGAFRHNSCGDPTFTLSGAPLQQDVCALGPSTALTPVLINVGSRNGFNAPVTMSFGAGLPAGFTGSFTTSPVTPPGTTNAVLEVDAATVATGTSFVTLRGSAAGEDKDLSLQVGVSTIAAAAPSLTAPGDAATNVAYAPTLSWTAAAQATSYVVEISTTADFAVIAYTETVTGTNHVVATPLAASTTYFWRVRASNACGDTNSLVRSFTTRVAPDMCPIGTTAQQTFFDNIENGTNGWTTVPSNGNDTTRWTIQTTRPFSATSSWRSGYPATGQDLTSDMTLTSPSIALPATSTATTLQFQHYRDIEENGAAACYDGGRLEVSVNGGAFTAVPAAQILVDPYYGTVSTGGGNVLEGSPAWCGLIPYTKAVVDLTPYVGSTVRLRYRFATDVSVSYEGWFVDDVLVQSCAPAGNANPTVSNPGTQAILEDAATGVLAVTVGDAETPAASLQLTATSGNTALVPNANIVLGGTGANRTVQVTPVANGSGTATITLTVTDANSGTATAAFDVVVTAVNDAPSFTVLGNRTHPAGTSGAQTVPAFVTGTNFGPGEAGQAVLDYIVVQNGGPAGVVTAVDVANDGTLSYTLSGAPGTVTIDATLQDNGGVANGGDDTSNVVSFTITVDSGTGADLSITKSDGAATAVLGQPVTYTIDVANAGPQAATGARVVDNVPAELVGATWTCTPTPPAACANASGTGSIDEPLNLASGQAVRYVLTGTVGGTVGGMLVNTASVNAPAGTPDPVGANNSATDTDVIVPDGVFANGFEN